jgi:hypothetical protein
VSTVHIHAPPAIGRAVKWRKCPDCRKRSPIASLIYEWYGPTSCCMRCGRRWSDGEWMALPSLRTARASSKIDMRRAWKAAKGNTWRVLDLAMAPTATAQESAS